MTDNDCGSAKNINTSERMSRKDDDGRTVDVIELW